MVQAFIMMTNDIANDPKSKHTFDSCYNEAKKYTTRNEFKHGSPGVYQYALKRGWLKYYTWIPETVHKTWTIKSAIEESKKYKTKEEFRKKAQYPHNLLRKTGHLDECVWLEREFNWTDENCTEISKNYSSEAEFNKEKPRGYAYAKKNNLLKTFTWLKKTIGIKDNPFWTKEKVSEEIKKYKYTNDLIEHCKGAYEAIRRNGWWNLLDVYPKFPDGAVYSVYVYDFPDYNTSYVGLTKRKNNVTGQNGRDDDHHGKGKYCDNPSKSAVYRFTKENGITEYSPSYSIDGLSAEEAKVIEGKEIEKYKALGRILLNKAKAGSLGQNGVKWTKEKVTRLAKEFILPGDFYRTYPGAYAAAHENGWIKEFDWMEHNKNSKWLIYENCYNEAKKYITRTEFARGSSSAYHTACKKKWLDTFTWLKKVETKGRTKYSYELCKQLCGECKNRKELEKKYNGCIQWLRLNHKDWFDEFLPKTR